MSINKIRKAEKERQESLKQEQFEFFREKKEIFQNIGIGSRNNTK